MLRSTFLLLPGVRGQTERGLWRQGIATWNDFLAVPEVRGLSPPRKHVYDRHLERARQAYLSEDTGYFSRLLPSAEMWRLYSDFADAAGYLDIETCYNNGQITVVGISDGESMKTLIRGANLSREALLEALSHFKILVTFNGAAFDVPLLERYFGFRLAIPHIDLRHVCARVGLTGGLKAIEKQVGIQRPKLLEHVTGADAARLWDVFWASGDRDYLDLLLEYNAQDVLNLEPLARRAICALWEKTYDSPGDAPPYVKALPVANL